MIRSLAKNGSILILVAGGFGLPQGLPSRTHHADIQVACNVRPAASTMESLAITAVAAFPSTHYSLAVCISGTGPYQFLIDTGSTSSTISPELATKLRLPLAQSLNVGSGTSIQRLRTVHVASWSLRSLIGLRAQNLIETSIPGYSGILGTDVLARFRAIALDLTGSTIHFFGQEGKNEASASSGSWTFQGAAASGNLGAPRGSDAVPLRIFREGLLVIPTVRIKFGTKYAVNALLDTGGAETVFDSSPTLSSILKTFRRIGDIQSAGGTTSVRLYQAQDWSLASVDLPSIPIAVAPQDITEPDVQGILGMDALTQIAFLGIDFGEGTLILGLKR